MRDYAELVKDLRDCSRRNARVCMICGAKASNLCEGTKAKRMFYAADAIEELLARVPKWISVEERLPTADDGDPFDRCLVFTDEGQLMTLPLCKVGMGYATHWMIVKPPKEVG